MEINIIPRTCTFFSEIVTGVNLTNATITGKIQINAVSCFDGVAGEIVLTKQDAKVKDFIMVGKLINHKCVAIIVLDTLDNDAINGHIKVDYNNMKMIPWRRTT